MAAIKKKSILGFSLIELSLATSILGFVIVTLFPTINTSNVESVDKLQITYEKMNDIHRAIALFKKKYGRIPCPANPNLAVGSTISHDSRLITYDDERISLLSSGAECSSNVGSLPTASLGLDPDYMIDGYGKRFTYRVSSLICGNGANKCDRNSYMLNEGDLIIRQSSSGANILSNVAYVLISFGEASEYYFSIDGTRAARTSSNADEQQNGDFTDTTSTNNIYVSREISSNFRHIVQYRTKQQIDEMFVDESSRVMTETECNANSNILALISSPIALDLRNATNPAMGSGFLRTNPLTNPNESYNYLDEAALEILWYMQEVCASYYNITKVCPGGASYVSASNSCYCASGLWNFNC